MHSEVSQKACVYDLSCLGRSGFASSNFATSKLTCGRDRNSALTIALLTRIVTFGDGELTQTRPFIPTAICTRHFPFPSSSSGCETCRLLLLLVLWDVCALRRALVAGQLSTSCIYTSNDKDFPSSSRTGQVGWDSRVRARAQFIRDKFPPFNDPSPEALPDRREVCSRFFFRKENLIAVGF